MARFGEEMMRYRDTNKVEPKKLSKQEKEEREFKKESNTNKRIDKLLKN